MDLKYYKSISCPPQMICCSFTECDDVGILDIDSIKSQYSSSVLDRMACKPKRSLEDVIPSAPPDGIDLLKKLLQFNPDKRLTAEQALKHPFVARFHNPEEEPSMDYDVIPALNDDVQLSVEEYRVKLYEVSACVLFVLSTYFEFIGFDRINIIK